MFLSVRDDCMDITNINNMLNNVLDRAVASPPEVAERRDRMTHFVDKALSSQSDYNWLAAYKDVDDLASSPYMPADVKYMASILAAEIKKAL